MYTVYIYCVYNVYMYIRIYVSISNSAIRKLCIKIQLALGPLTLTLFPRTWMCAHLWDVQNISLFISLPASFAKRRFQRMSTPHLLVGQLQIHARTGHPFSKP